jgi:L-threonylcarbamoyladenylate synthase
MMSQTQSHNDVTSSSSTHEDKHSQSQSQPPKNAKLISTSTQSMSEAGARIRSGHLVSFPTETVYGLGCHAMDPIAVSRVFEAKERPLTDPLIVHVNESHAALALWQASASASASEDGHGHGHGLERKALEALAETFWPGPLTIVAKANPAVPPIIMANTGYVACRSPSHPIARALIGASGVPIAAPSANKFGHVSPTRAAHVMYDLGLEDVWIVDPDLDSDCNDNGSHDDHEQKNAVCDVGVESTVAKVEMTSETCGIVSILRHGAVSSTHISSCLEAIGLKDHFDVKEKMQSTGENVSHVAPGQTIRHYSPDVLSFMISHERYNADTEAAQNGPGLELNNEELEWLKNAVIIDFGNRLGSLKDGALAYRDLSAEGNSSAAAANVFDALRWSENVEGAQRVYFPEIIIDESCVEKEEALVLAVKDRLTRAASGVVINTLQ